MKEEFEIRTMGFGELAQLYNPKVSPISASNTLRRWIKMNRELNTNLIKAGHRKYAKVLTPLQVKLIIQYLGNP